MTNLQELLVRCKRVSWLYFWALVVLFVFIAFVIIGIILVIIFPANGTFDFLVITGSVMLMLSFILVIVFPTIVSIGNLKLNRIRQLVTVLKQDQSLSNTFRQQITTSPLGTDQPMICSVASFAACRLLLRFCTDELTKNRGNSKMRKD